jgi:hypothetical protein
MSAGHEWPPVAQVISGGPAGTLQGKVKEIYCKNEPIGVLSFRNLKFGRTSGMIRAQGLISLVFVGIQFVYAQPINPTKFKPGCTLPFADIASQGLDIDSACGITGNGTNMAKELESRAKNNFCATGEPVTINYAAFKRLQRRTEDRLDAIKPGLKTDRTAALSEITKLAGTPLGEGSLVRYVAYLLEAHYSNTKPRKPPKKNGELVNCNEQPDEFNDIHIELVPDAGEDDACASITAEMSPHFRPESWDSIVGLRLNNRPVRITGPLFFDGSHTPCTNEKRASPPRITVWEIHPVYHIDVCTKRGIENCDADDDGVWVSLDQWNNQGDENDEDHRQ